VTCGGEAEVLHVGKVSEEVDMEFGDEFKLSFYRIDLPASSIFATTKRDRERREAP
jgi:hypothetical protein